ncbi:MAG: cyclic pyranopterin phosphate synthase MoaA [Planctomycetes bacterium RBG_16_55_9]|nr:MAG: cyclic pyranopterin phosphate synthase MoaA [Planctomycetes bacterium RBG_16_55_9]
MNVDYLRISVTDRCNLQCVYCNPLGCCQVTQSDEVLIAEEIKRAVRLLVDCGIRKVRITGGEPLVREDIVALVGELAGVDGIEDLSLTTNGVFLGALAPELKAAGLQRVNVSVDSMDRHTYKRISGFDLLPSVVGGVHKAMEVGLTPVKINSVVIKGLNDSDEQIAALAEMSVRLPVAVRFIEYYPTNTHTRPAADYVPNRMVRTIIERWFGPLSGAVMAPGNGPALYFKIRDSAGAIGFISGRSSIFCHSCSRLRLTSSGKLMPCLYSARTYDLGTLMRNDATDEQIRDFVKVILSEKNRFTKSNSFKEEFSMCGVGG